MQSGALADVPAILELEFTHPAFADRDQLIALHLALPDEAGNPVWVGHFVDVPDGRWYVTLKSGDAWRLSGEWRGESSLMLRASGRDRDGAR